MKTSKEILGLPLMCIKEGMQCGIVSELIIDTENKAVGFIVTDTGKSYFGLKVLPFTSISGIGQSLVTTKTYNSVTPLFESQEALKLSFCSASLIGASVISYEGNIIGEINEFTVDDENGNMIECQLTDGSIIDASSILNITPGYVFIGENGESMIDIHTEPDVPEPTPVLATPISNVEPEPIQEPAPAPVKQEAPVPQPEPENLLDKLKSQPAAEPAAPASGEAGNLLERLKGKGTDDNKTTPASDGLLSRLQTQYLIGKTVTKDIEDNGQILAAMGETVTQDLVDKLRKANKHIELTLNVE